MRNLSNEAVGWLEGLIRHAHKLRGLQFEATGKQRYIRLEEDVYF